MNSKEVAAKAQEYYNSKDADEFYYHIWGGKDIHVGLYESEDEAIAKASHRTVETMAAMLPELSQKTHVLDMGSGYGGAARHLHLNHGCTVTCLNLSETQNARNRATNETLGLNNSIQVIDGNFEQMPFEDDSFEVVWCEDSILHSGAKEQVIKEVARVLKPGGHFIFTDPMQADEVPPGALDNVLGRIHLSEMGSYKLYRELAAKAGLTEVEVQKHDKMLPLHYERVRQDLQGRYDELKGVCTQEYIDRMLEGLQHWVNAGKKGHLAWGILHFRK